MHLVSHILDFIAPSECQACGRFASMGPLGLLCQACRSSLPDNARRITGPPSIVETLSMGPYASPLGVLVKQAKYGPHLGAADALGRRLGKALQGLLDVDAVVAIPIPRARRWRRGFCQGERMARGVAAASGLPLLPLLRRRSGPTQVGQRAAARRRLSASNFVVQVDGAPDRILLVDDVRTTGATLHAAARALKRRGTQHVWAATACFQGE
jgi:ComF family protein